MKENISALMDGELGDREAGSAIDAMKAGGEAREAWRTYHLVSDAMRDTRLLSAGFAARVAERLEKEPTVLAPRRLRSEPARAWIGMPAAAAASVAGVALVGWLALAPQQTATGPIARAPVEAPPPAPQPAAPQIVPLPSGTDDYLLAHQGFSPRLTLQGMAPYARTVSARAHEARR